MLTWQAQQQFEAESKLSAILARQHRLKRARQSREQSHGSAYSLGEKSVGKSVGKSGADKLSELSLPSSSEQHVGTQIVGAIIHDDDDDIGDTAKWDTAKVSISN